MSNQKENKGKLILVVGMTGQGKSTFIKNFVANRPHYIFDLNNEYAPEGYNCAPLTTGEFGEKYPDMKQFVKDCFLMNNATCVFEEATGFFKGRVSSEVDRLLVAKRHQKNDYIFVFHSVQSIPPQIFLLSNYVVLLKTNDNPKVIKSKYPHIYNSFLELQQMPKYSHKIIQLN